MPAALNAIVGGWTITGVNVMTSGQPINLRYTTLPSEAFRVTADLAAFQGGVSLRPDVIGDPVTPRDGRTIDNYLNRNTVLVPSLASNRPFGTAGRNTARSNAFFQLDMGLHKSFPLPITEETRVEFRTEVFNLLNKTNFRAADGNRSSASFGRITSAFPARQIQFALKLYF